MRSSSVGSSSSTAEGVAGGAVLMDGAWLAELLSAVAEARDFPAASALFLAQVSEGMGAQRSRLLELNDVRQSLEVAAEFGDDPPGPTSRLPTEDPSHPLVLAALSLVPVAARSGGRVPGIPFSSWLAVPYPRPLVRGALPLLAEERAREMLQ